MKKIYSGKVIKRSPDSYGLSLPKQYVIDGSFKLGDEVLIVVEQKNTGINLN